MNTKNNKRSQYSIKKLKKAITKLLKTEDHDKITIKDLCKEAEINRTTFYAHFDDMESLLYEICEDYIVSCYQIFLNTNIAYKTRIKMMVEFMQEDFEFFAYVFKNVHNLEIKILDMIENLYTDKDFVSGAEKSKLSLAFVISGFVGVGKIYFTSDKYTINSEEFADILYNVINTSNPYLIIK